MASFSCCHWKRQSVRLVLQWRRIAGPQRHREKACSRISLRRGGGNGRGGGGGTLLVVVMAAAGETHSLAVTNSWRVFSWGHGALGALGWADLSSHFVPVEIDTLVAKHERVVLAAAGCAHSILVTEQGNVWTSGSFSSTCTPPPSAPSPAASLSPAPGLVGGGGQKKGF